MHLCHRSITIEPSQDAARSQLLGRSASLEHATGRRVERSTPQKCPSAESAGQNLPLLGEALRGVASKLAEIAEKNRFSRVRHGDCSSYSGKTPAVGVPGEEPAHRKE